jgi:hypothetical protein
MNTSNKWPRRIGEIPKGVQTRPSITNLTNTLCQSLLQQSPIKEKARINASKINLARREEESQVLSHH